ncbi:hypothetical protein RIF29_10680 [Crotalaria pallida]|uniref:Probable purine permease n=1 Tax=Crotalaria pallida TaxID=3830 RepID=A0AAN9FT41_CROPI
MPLHMAAWIPDGSSMDRTLLFRMKEKDLEEAQRNIDETNVVLRSKEDDVTVRLAKKGCAMVLCDERYDKQGRGLVAIIKATVDTNLLYAMGSFSLSDGEKRYGLVQCSRDINSSQCKQCLDAMLNKFPQCCEKKLGWQVLAPSCLMKYDDNMFYLITAQTNETISPSPLPNPGIGSFAASLRGNDVLVMNVVPQDGLNTLKLIYDRGLIGSDHDCFLQTAGFPIILLPLSFFYLRHRRRRIPDTTNNTKYNNKMFFSMEATLFFASAFIGVLYGITCYLYSYGVARLPVSTATLIGSTNLAFVALFAFLLVISREARQFGLGETNYYLVLVGTAVICQVYFLGLVGVIYASSSLFSGIIISMLLPVIEILGVVFYKEKFKAEKGVSLALCLWGFASYFYGEFKQANEIKKVSIPEKELPQDYCIANP